MKKVLLLLLSFMISQFAKADAGPFLIHYDQVVSPVEQAVFEKMLLQSYNFVSSRFLDQSDRSRCKIQINFVDMNGTHGYTHPPIRPCGDDVIQLDPKLEGDPNASVIVAHELVHVIRYQSNVNEARWLNEGMAKEIEYQFVGSVDDQFDGKWPRDDMKILHSEPDFRLYEDLTDFKPDGSGYASAFVFFHYLLKHFGGVDFFQELMRSKDSGWTAIENVTKQLASQGLLNIPVEHLNRNHIWSNFAVALLLNDANLGDRGMFLIDYNYSIDFTPMKSSADLLSTSAMPANSIQIFPAAGAALTGLKTLDLSNSTAWEIFNIQTLPTFAVKNIDGISAVQPFQNNGGHKAFLIEIGLPPKSEP